MKCRKIKKYLSAYVDGQTGQTSQSQIEAHLQTCDECSAQVEQYRQMWEWLGEEVTLKPNPFFAAKVWRRIREIEAPPEPKIQWLRRFELLLVPATVAAGLVLGILLGSQLTSEIDTSRSYSSTAAEIIDNSVQAFSDLPEGSLTAAYENLGLMNNGS